MARSAVSLAALYNLLRPPPAPLAASMIFFFRAWWATPDLTRGMDRSLRLEEAVHAREVGRAHDIALLEPVLPLARLLGQDVTVVRVEAFELPRAGANEPLHGGALGLLLGHRIPLGAPRAPYFGAITMVMFRPSSLASISILPMSASAAATRSSTALPRSRWAICRPRYIIVTLTLLPSPRNSRACRVLKSKSWSSMPGRNFTSFNWMMCCFFFAAR